MKLGVMERLMLMNLLANAEGNVLTLRIVRDLQSELGFSEEELQALNIVQEPGRIVWNQSADVGKEIDIGSRAQEIISGALKKLDDVGKLTMNQLALYEKFVEGETSEPKASEPDNVIPLNKDE